MLRSAIGLALILLGSITAAGVAPITRDPGDTPRPTPSQRKQNYYDALLGNVTLQVFAGPNGSDPTVETVIWQICQQAGVPYQADRSRRLVGNRLATRVAPVTLDGMSAGTAIQAFSASAGLAPQLDHRGVFVTLPSKVSTPDQSRTADFDSPSRRAARSSDLPPLSRMQRAQIGAGLTVRVNPSVTRHQSTGRTTSPDPNDEDEETVTVSLRTTHSMRLDISLVSTKTLNDVSAIVTFYGHEYADRRTLHGFHTETLSIGDLFAGQWRRGRTGAGTATVTDTEYWAIKWREGDDRSSVKTRRQREHRTGKGPTSGTRYYGWTIDIYAGGQLVKCVASNRAMFGSLGRDPSTGFPK